MYTSSSVVKGKWYQTLTGNVACLLLSHLLPAPIHQRRLKFSIWARADVKEFSD